MKVHESVETKVIALAVMMAEQKVVTMVEKSVAQLDQLMVEYWAANLANMKVVGMVAKKGPSSENLWA